MADIPGIIEGASKGKGLGLRFLRHIERNRLLLLLVDGTEKDPVAKVEAIKNELKTYNKSLLLKRIYVIRTKGDILNEIDNSIWEAIPEYLMEISSVSHKGLSSLVKTISKTLNEI